MVANLARFGTSLNLLLVSVHFFGLSTEKDHLHKLKIDLVA